MNDEEARGVRYRVEGHRATFVYKSTEEDENGKLIHVVNELTGGSHTFRPDDLLPITKKRKYTSKLPDDMKIPKDRQPQEVKAFGQSVTML